MALGALWHVLLGFRGVLSVFCFCAAACLHTRICGILFYYPRRARIESPGLIGCVYPPLLPPPKTKAYSALPLLASRLRKAEEQKRLLAREATAAKEKSAVAEVRERGGGFDLTGG